MEQQAGRSTSGVYGYDGPGGDDHSNTGGIWEIEIEWIFCTDQNDPEGSPGVDAGQEPEIGGEPARRRRRDHNEPHGETDVFTPTSNMGYTQDTNGDITTKPDQFDTPTADGEILDTSSVTDTSFHDLTGDGTADDLVVGTTKDNPTFVFIGDGTGDYKNVVPFTLPDSNTVTDTQSYTNEEGHTNLVFGHLDGPSVVLIADKNSPNPNDRYTTGLSHPLGGTTEIHEDTTVQDHDNDPSTPPRILITTENGIAVPVGPVFDAGGQHVLQHARRRPSTFGSPDGSGNVDVVFSDGTNVYILQDALRAAPPTRAPTSRTRPVS